MRFCDFFIEYKILLKDEKRYIKWPDLPLYRKIMLVMMFLCVIVAIALFVLSSKHTTFLLIGALTISLVVVAFVIVDAQKTHMKKMLEDHYKKYSQDHMKKVKELLRAYEINIHDDSTLDDLIVMAEYELDKNNPMNILKVPCKIFAGSILPLGIYMAKRISEQMDIVSLIDYTAAIIIIIICLVSAAVSIYPAIRWVVFNDYDKYTSLIYDLKQMKTFKANQL